jgi:hypothetical protein
LNDRAYLPKRKELPFHHLHREQILIISILLSVEALPHPSVAPKPIFAAETTGELHILALKAAPSVDNISEMKAITTRESRRWHRKSGKPG